MSEGEGRRFGWGLLGVFLLALAARLYYLWELKDSLLLAAALGDGRRYLEWASEIAAGDWLGTEVFYQAPLYPYLLALATRIVGPDLGTLRLLQALAGAISCGLLAIAGRRLFSTRAGLIAGVLVAVYPPAIFFGALIQKSSLAFFLLALLMALLAIATELPAGRRCAMVVVGAGLTLGALALTRENALILVPVVAVWSMIGPPRPAPRQRWSRLALLLVGLALALVPVGLRNQAVGGTFLLTTSQLGSNLYIGNRAGADGRYAPLRPGRQDARVEREDAILLAERAIGRPPSADEVSRYWRNRALTFIAENPGEWTVLMGRKLRLLLQAREVADTESLEAYRSESAALDRSASVFHFGLLLAFAGLGAWSVRGRWRELWWLFAILLSLAFSVVIFYVMARYRFLLVAPLALFAGAGVEELIDRVRRRLLAPSLAAAAILIAITWMATRPLPIRTLPAATTWYNLGTVLFEEGSDEMAKEALERAAALAPQAAPIQVRLGRVALAQGRSAAAGEHFETATEADPLSLEAHLDLARWALSIGDRETAAVEYHRSLELSTEAPETWLPLAQGLALVGDFEAAESLLRRALRSDAGNAPAWNLVGNVQAQLGRTEEARAAYETAISLEPDLADAHFKLGVLLQEMGDPEGARRHLQTAVRLAPDFPEAARRLWEVEGSVPSQQK